MCPGKRRLLVRIQEAGRERRKQKEDEAAGLVLLVSPKLVVAPPKLVMTRNRTCPQEFPVCEHVRALVQVLLPHALYTISCPLLRDRST